MWRPQPGPGDRATILNARQACTAIDSGTLRQAIRRCTASLLMAVVILAAPTTATASDDIVFPADLAGAHDALEKLHGKLTAARKRIRELEQQLADHERDARAARLERARERSEKSEQGFALLKAKIAVKELEAEAASLRNQLDVAKAQIAKFGSGATGVGSDGDETIKLKAALAKAEAEVEASKAAAKLATAEAASLRVKLKAANATLETVGLEGDGKGEQADLQAQLAEARMASETLKAKLAALEFSHNETLNELAQLQTPGAKTDDGLKAKLSAAEQRAAKLQEDARATDERLKSALAITS